tara:strand:- start:597 stop:716 length:120 start_codon:yes stop_codon:yes gene_type:complete
MFFLWLLFLDAQAYKGHDKKRLCSLTWQSLPFYESENIQ